MLPTALRDTRIAFVLRWRCELKLAPALSMVRNMRGGTERARVKARALGALGAVAFGVAALAAVLPIWYRVPQDPDQSGGNALVHWSYVGIGYLAVGLFVIAAWQSNRHAAGQGSGSRALAAGGAGLILYSIWFFVWEWVPAH